VTDPEEARAAPGAVGALHELSREMALVAAISGRPAGFLAERLEMARYRSPLRAIGLHGLEEWSPDGTVGVRAEAVSWRPTIEAVHALLLAAIPAGVRVEDKGYGITVHWRSLGATGAELAAIAARTTGVVRAVGAEHGLVARSGKASVELAVPLGVDKGSVVSELCRELERACYLGDDLGDLLAFRALDRLGSTTGLVGLKVAVTGAEAPRDLLAEADLVLEGPGAASGFLLALAGRIHQL
jgi:trehalose 6-phosphate phosphatase